MHILPILCEIETSFLADAEFKTIRNEKIKNKVFTIDFSLNLQSKFIMNFFRIYIFKVLTNLIKKVINNQNILGHKPEYKAYFWDKWIILKLTKVFKAK